MKQLISMQHNQTMTSKELVEVINAIRKEEGNTVEIQHSNLMQRIKGFDQILGALAIQVAEYLDNQGKPRPMLLLSKEACLLAVSSESPRINLAIIRRWQELEAQARPLTYLEALKELVAKEEENQRIQIENLQKTVVIKEKKDITDEGEEYFSVKRIKSLNPDTLIGGVKLSKSAEKLQIPPKQMFAHWDANSPIAWHVAVWLDAYPEIVLPE